MGRGCLLATLPLLMCVATSPPRQLYEFYEPRQLPQLSTLVLDKDGALADRAECPPPQRSFARPLDSSSHVLCEFQVRSQQHNQQQ